MARRKFFILDYTLSDDYIDNLLCQVVGNKYDPKPSLESDQRLAHKHFPNLLPKPNITANRKECFDSAASLAAKLKLPRLFHLDVDRSQEERTKLESELVKRYSLAGGPAKFKRLMEDSQYAAHVREVLMSKRSRRAYFVEGFMTTTNATWSRTVAESASSGAGVTATGGGGSGAAGLEAAADATRSSRAGNASEWVSPGEEIFSVSYLEVKLKGKGFLDTGPKNAVIGDVVVASNKTAALSPGNHQQKAVEAKDEDDVESGSESSSSESEEEDEDEDGEVVLSAEEWGVVEGLDSFLEIDVTFE